MADSHAVFGTEPDCCRQFAFNPRSGKMFTQRRRVRRDTAYPSAPSAPLRDYIWSMPCPSRAAGHKVRRRSFRQTSGSMQSWSIRFPPHGNRRIPKVDTLLKDWAHRTPKQFRFASG
jgi:hypothetical protein